MSVRSLPDIYPPPSSYFGHVPPTCAAPIRFYIGKFCGQNTCLSLCLFVCVSHKLRVQILPHFTTFSIHITYLSVAVVRFSSDGSAICFVLPVLCMTSYYHIMQGIGQNQRQHVCFVPFTRWRHRSEICRLRLHLVLNILL